ARVVHHDVDAAESIQGFAHGIVYVGALRDIGCDGDRGGANLMGDRYRACAVDVEHGDFRAFSRKDLRDFSAEARRGSCHDGHLVFKAHLFLLRYLSAYLERSAPRTRAAVRRSFIDRGVSSPRRRKSVRSYALGDDHGVPRATRRPSSMVEVCAFFSAVIAGIRAISSRVRSVSKGYSGSAPSLRAQPKVFSIHSGVLFRN